jgi:hypothetical protein
MREPRFKVGDHGYMRKNGSNNSEHSIPVKITAVKRQSMNNITRGVKPKYNVKIIGTKEQKQNVPEQNIVYEIRQEWEKNDYYGGKRRKTRKATRRTKRYTRRR